ncbi:copper resistance protein CopC [Paenibacillus tuaregi]|uniref:copper resistance protein CopC n=1 Tax=Paenibacillus tuaregi TaxID=1816681 RepID=UPI000AE8785A|nr:copper resistance protein CopC [Paenibacillus tuaregi]
MKIWTRHTWITAVLVLCMCFILYPGRTFAHAYIVKSTPAANEALDQSPDTVTIVFNEAIEKVFHSLTVTNTAGERVDLDNSHIDDNNPARLDAGLKKNLPDGIYTVSWRVVSADGHAISGVIPFIVGSGGTAPVQEADSGAKALPGLDQTLIRWLQYTGLSLYLGTLFFHLFLLPKAKRKESYNLGRSQAAIIVSFVLTFLGVVLSLPLQAKLDAGVTWSEVWSNNVLGEALRYSSFGSIWWTQVLLLLVLAGLTYALIPKWSQGEKPVFAGLALGTILCMFVAKAFMGHAAAAELESVAIGADFIHLAAASLWLGGLLALAFLLPAYGAGEPDTAARKQLYWGTIRRFSVTGAVCVLLVLGTGLYGIKIYTPTLSSLFTSIYGQVLLAKIVLFIVMLVFALTGFLRGRRMNRELGPAVWIEFSAGIVTLVLAAILSNLPTALSNPGPVHLEDKTRSGHTVMIDISPNIMGKNEFKVTVQDPDGKPVNGIEATSLKLTSLEMEMGTLEINMPGNTSPVIKDDLITMAGRWQIKYHVLLKSLDSLDGLVNFTVGNPK